MADNKKKSLFSEFKTFISRGNVLDMAVGVIVGGAFTAIVTSLVNDIFMPAIGGLLSGINFTELKVTIPAAIEGMADVTICYGNFIQSVVVFLLTAVAVFLLVKAVNRFRAKKEKPAEPPKPSEEVLLLREIRDQLKEK